MDNPIKRVSFAGAGKVARQMAPWLKENGVQIVQVYNRSHEQGEPLAAEVSAEFISNASALELNVDLIIVAVSDDAIAGVSQLIPQTGALVVHTSGTRAMDDLKHHARRGVFYPLQSFSDKMPVDFRKIPFCIEAANLSDEELLKVNCLTWGSYTYPLNSQQREILHIAAVMANNFVNHLWGKGFDLLKKNDIQPDILFPLMMETVNKAIHSDPHEVQTGPAVRKDENTIQRHVEMLKKEGNLQQIYQLLTKSIQEKHHGKL